MEVPLISSTQKIVLYETKARFYLVGSNNNETKFRVLKIDRTEPRELAIHDDKVEYTQGEIKNLLTMIYHGNKTRMSQRSNNGMSRSVSAYGIVGFVRFLEGYYIILITKRRKIALIGSHTVYKVEDTSMIYIPNETVRVIHPDESRYEKLFQNVDLSSNFYFSYSYDLTHTLQYNMMPSQISIVPESAEKKDNTRLYFFDDSTDGELFENRQAGMPAKIEAESSGPIEDPGQTFQDFISLENADDSYLPFQNVMANQPLDESIEQDTPVYGVKNEPYVKFTWNMHLLDKFSDVVHSDWVLHLIHGFIGQSCVSIFGKPIYVTLIARRSNKFAGTRFLKRGANCEGAVANEVETEQIVLDASETFLSTGRVTSFVQLRGSIPLFWSQDISSMMPKPPIMLDQADPFAYVAGLHFNDCTRRYGAPIIVLNLVKTREKKRHESILSGEYREAIEYLNQFLPPEHNIQYIGFDMARINKRKDSNVLVRLGKIAKYSLKRTGFYFHGVNHTDTEMWNDEHLAGIQGFKTSYGLRQTGVVRTNCVDCLDRTNTAQFAVGKCALGYQLYALGVVSEPMLEFDTDCVRLLEELYEDQGDTLALQYGGSHLVHRIKGYRKIAPWTSHSLDIMRTLSRYYSNAFSDADKQHAINLFLGVFKPQDGKLNLWEMSTDYYLHNRQATNGKAWMRKSYSQWWDSPIPKVLPLPYDEEAKGSEGKQMVIKTHKNDEKVSGYWDYYKPYELTSMDELFSFTIPSSVKNFMPKTAQNFSPFSRRIRPDRRHDETGTTGMEANPNVSGKESTASNTSTGSEGSSSSSSDSSDVDADIDLSDSTETSFSDHDSHFVSLKDLPCSKEVYDFEISNPSRRVESCFRRYVEFEEASKREPEPSKRGIELYPISAFKLDSSYCVEPPPVSRQSKDIYNAYILRGKYGPGPPTDQDMKMYRQYVSSKYK
ncbi:polyphosphoinositide phosphatase-like isoform X2 [Liolophura sinensis]|uniref:polyphosphoinositide phosphatase-like isoform X2 n=1 Tax=Liolophura sinensis TaxID=3198878 RepID=UPI0031582B36